jgi:tetratricopeptide (TPR) repeat protein
MPLENLFKVGRSSTYDTEAQEASLFYAQSWALIHYMMIGDETGHSKMDLVEYVRLLQSGVGEGEARRRAFGNLRKLEAAVDSYVHRFLFKVNEMTAPRSISPHQLTVRKMSSAESAAVRGDFLVRGTPFLTARAFFELALQEEPNLSRAHLGMGLWHLRQDQRKEALEWFEKAVRLGSRSCLAHYYKATLRLAHAGGSTQLEQAAQGLRHALELNPDFAPALAKLAFVYGEQNRNMEEALRLTQRAIELEPMNPYHYINAGHFLMSMDRFDEAREYGQKGLEVSEKSSTKRLLLSFMNKLEGSHRTAPSYRTQANIRGIWLKGQMRREEILTTLLTPDFSS